MTKIILNKSHPIFIAFIANHRFVKFLKTELYYKKFFFSAKFQSRVLKMKKKIIFTGPPFAGKTSIRLFFFEKTHPIDILPPNSIEPTRGIHWINYTNSGYDLGVCDSSGQEISQIIRDKELFQGSDIVIFQFDITDLEFEELKQDYIDYLMQLLSIREQLGEEYEIVVFCHKIDLIKREELKEVKNKIKNIILNAITDQYGYHHGISIFFTSVKSFHADSTHNLLRKIVLYQTVTL